MFRSNGASGTGIARIGALLAAFAGTIALLTACTVGPDYVRPAAETPQAFKESAEWKTAQPKDHLPRGAWWEIYNDSQLNDLIKQVDVSNQNLAAAEAQFRQARASVAAARAGFFPTLTTAPSYTRTRRSANMGTSSGSAVNPRTRTSSSGSSATTSADYNLPFDVSWEPDIWGKVRRTVESNRATAQASAADLEATRLLLQAELAQDYFQLRTLDREKKLLVETADAYRTFLNMTKNQYESGIATKAAVLQAETQLKSTEAQAVDVGVQRAQMEHAIAVLMGKPPSALSIPFSPLTEEPPAIPAALPSELLERRPDVAGAERRMAAANAQIGIAVAAYYPTLSLSASGGFEASHIADWFAWPSRFWSIGSALSQVIFDAGLRRAQTNQAKAAYEGTVATYRQTVLTGFQEVEDNLSSLRILEEESKVQDEAVIAARQAVTFTLNQYKAGTTPYLNVIISQAAALNNERTAVTILGNRMAASVLLIKAIGGGWTASELPSNEKLTEGAPFF